MREEILSQLRGNNRQIMEAVGTLQMLIRRNASIMDDASSCFGTSEIAHVSEANDYMGNTVRQLANCTEEMEYVLKKLN